MTTAPSSPRGRRGLAPLGNDPYRRLRAWERWVENAYGICNPFHRAVEGVIGAHARIDGRELLSFSSYNYLGFSGDPAVSTAAKEAIDRYGTSVSASRAVAGERPLHRALERAVADLIGVDDALAFVSGHATNVTTLGCLFGPRDLILYDILSHNSLQQGIRLSGARGLPFPHNNVAAAESLLARERASCDRALLVTEGVFSMDGDIAPVPEFVALRAKYNAHLMVDEAHSMGVLGATGRGIVEHFGLPPDSVDLWMGTFSKAFASCGGYIAGCRETIDGLRGAAPGFVYSCGMTPPNAAAALESIRRMGQEPERVARLAARADRFRSSARAAGFDVGSSSGSAVVPVILGNSARTIVIAHLLFERGLVVHPLFYPVVPERAARLRFFITSEHSVDDIDRAVAELRLSASEADDAVASLPPEMLAQWKEFDGS
ncbi:MAG: aminotransferase class I/II-fold pyridoxal phosphate-dependent enzyme [Planctomycetaceae bacterium]|nr:aminotransferase class I/II-fold pyridoxal phosphate-dependent enzyme [Planctomycetaceae bacterium]